VNQPAFVNQLGMLLHIDATGKKPEFTMADLKVSKMCSGDAHD